MVRFDVKVDDLLWKLKLISKVLPNRPVDESLLGIHFQYSSNGIILTASNSDTTVRGCIPFLEKAEIGRGDFSVRGSIFVSLIFSFMPGSVVRFVITDTGLKLSCGKSKYFLKFLDGRFGTTLSGENFKRVMRVSGGENVSMFRESLKKILVTVSRDPFRPELCGGYVELDTNLKMVSLNGHSLTEVTLSVSDLVSMEGVVIPTEAFEIVEGMLSAGIDSFDMGISDNMVRFSCEELVVYSLLIESSFPKYQEFILSLDEYEEEFSMDVDLLRRGLDRLSVVADRLFPALKMTFCDDRAVFESRTFDDVGGVEEFSISGSGIELEPIWINLEYLRDVLGAVDGDMKLYLRDPMTPLQMLNGNARVVIMPIRPMDERENE